MKLALSVVSPHIDAQLDRRFGRCAYFLITDPETQEWQGLENPAVNTAGGAGIQAAEVLSKQDCKAVISGEFGPKAFNALQVAGIRMYSSGSCTTAVEAIQKFKDGQLEPFT